MSRLYSLKRKQTRSMGGDIFIFTVILLISAFMALPFVYAIAQSLKPMEELFVFPPRFFVINPTLENFIQLFQVTSNLWVIFERYVFNSLFITCAATFLHVLFASMAAMPLAKYKFPGSGTISKIIVMALLFVPEVTYIPQYIVMSKLGMINTYWAMLLPFIATPLGLFLMQQFMSQIPDAMLESATIDGAGTFRTYWSIIMPNVKPALFTLVIFSFQSIWNREGGSFIYAEQLKVLPTIFKQISVSGIARAGVGAAAAVVLMIPPIITFVVAQNKVLQTMTHSGIKG